ncbi:MAG: substrate-binding domain-containing protein, partial [Hypericibacter sp.]
MTRDRDDIHDGLDLTATRRRLLQVALGAGGAAALGAGALGAFPGSAAAAAGGGAFPEHKPWKFAFVNHVTTNPFFVPTQYGIADACALLGCSYQWTGSQKSVAAEMVNAMNTAIAAKVDGIAVCLVDLHAFNDPVTKALEAGIPVFAYNADAKGNNRLAYIGQDLYLAGKALGERIVSLVDEGEVVGFI